MGGCWVRGWFDHPQGNLVRVREERKGQVDIPIIVMDGILQTALTHESK